jgi:hypothetical protein
MYGGIAAAVAAFGVFVALAQAHVIVVPYFTPTMLKLEGLEQTYPVAGKVKFTVAASGYGSNCHMLQAEIQHEGQRKAFYRRADDCRFMTITYGPYNLTRSFEYGGKDVVGEKGTYDLDVEFQDLVVNGSKASIRKTFNIGTE